jgi:hypothetical protein
MKQLQRKLAGILFLLIFIVPLSCKKYDDGPWFSIYSKTERVTGNWRFELVREDGIDKTEEYANQSVNIRKNGDLYWIQGYYEDNPRENYGEGGKWSFVKDKEQIEMHFLYGIKDEYTLVWDIKRLAYGDLRLERHEDGIKIEWKMWKPY